MSNGLVTIYGMPAGAMVMNKGYISYDVYRNNYKSSFTRDICLRVERIGLSGKQSAVTGVEGYIDTIAFSRSIIR